MVTGVKDVTQRPWYLLDKKNEFIGYPGDWFEANTDVCTRKSQVSLLPITQYVIVGLFQKSEKGKGKNVVEKSRRRKFCCIEMERRKSLSSGKIASKVIRLYHTAF